MKNNVYIFIGQSGSGKGTQVSLLQKKVQTLDPSIQTYHLETGDTFRKLISENGYTAKRTKELLDEGVLPPAFLGIHAWSHLLIENYDGAQYVFIDGTPRVAVEVPALLSAFEFYDWHPHVFYIQVGDEWAYDRLVNRGRPDDKDSHDVWNRIQWFHESVIPAIELLKASDRVEFHLIHGEQTIEAVHQDICAALDI